MEEDTNLFSIFFHFCSSLFLKPFFKIKIILSFQMNFCSGPSDHRYFQNHFTPSSLMPPEFSNEFSIRSLSPTTTPSLTSSYPMTALLHRRLLSILERAQRSGKILNNHYYISLFILRLVERKPLIKIYFYPMTALYQTIDKNLF